MTEKIGLYPGSFNPWHAGHSDIILKALKIFDRIIIVQAYNPEKEKYDSASARFDILKESLCKVVLKYSIDSKKIWAVHDDRTLKSMIADGFIGYPPKPTAVIRGLRNGDDLQYEMNQQYWNEDVGVPIPFTYFITARGLSHVSSSAIRLVEKLGLEHDY